jgi:alpha-galactosidase
VGGEAGFEVERESLPAEAGIELTRLVFRFAAEPVPVLIEWCVPLVDIAGKWHCAIGSDRSLTAEWTKYLESYATLNAPVLCAFSAGGANRLTFAVSDAVNPVKLQAQVEEDTAELRCRVVLFDAPMPAEVKECVVVLRRDRRDVAYHRADRGTGHTCAHVGDICQLEQTLQGAVLAECPVQHWEEDVDPVAHVRWVGG